MSQVENRLREIRAKGSGALVGYFPLGYPSLQESIDAAVVMCENGVDVLELGIPYSDPVMDGPAIQQASMEALENGFKVKEVFDAIAQIRSRTDTPVLVMTYWNPVVQFGEVDFAEALRKSGAAGAITPDLIPDEAETWLAATDEHNLDRVFLATPTSSSTRAQKAGKLSRGFVYAVSTMGTTGARDELDTKAREVVRNVREQAPQAVVCVGIGVSTAEQVREINAYADGAIVGSAFVNAYRQGGLSALAAKTKELAQGKQR